MRGDFKYTQLALLHIIVKILHENNILKYTLEYSIFAVLMINTCRTLGRNTNNIR